MLFVAFLMAFAVKVPMASSHFGCQMPTLKPQLAVPWSGGDHAEAWCLRFLAFLLPIAPDASHSMAGLMITFVP